MKLAKTDEGIVIIEVDPSKKLLFIIEDESGVFDSATPLRIEDGTIIYKNKSCKMSFVEFEDKIKVKI